MLYDGASRKATIPTQNGYDAEIVFGFIMHRKI
jgi:hypothetical protein